MKLRIATFNVENLFTRPAAMQDKIGAEGQAAINAHAELNNIIEKDVYSAADKKRLLALDKVYKFSSLNQPKNALVKLNKVRGKLFATSGGKTSVAASGRADWVGWFYLPARDIQWMATYNTGRVIAETDADIQICVEVEDRPTLMRFNEQVLDAEFGKRYPHIMVIDGNDERGIDVGIMSRFPIVQIVSHVDDLGTNEVPIFSRDCPEYAIELPGGRMIKILPNHFKSKRGGDNASVQERRKAQAQRAHDIAKAALKQTDLVLIGGDLNDNPDFDGFAPLWKDGFVDVSDHASYPKDRPGTYATGTAVNKIDYLIMSPKLRAKLVETGIERRGTFHPKTWEPFDTVKGPADEASDHHLVWAEFKL